MDKGVIIQNFSRYAHSYDKYANIQKCAAWELANWVRVNGFRNILELGCGTGNYTAILRKQFKQAEIVAVDISQRMIEVAKDKVVAAEFICADAEDLGLDKQFDLITSNACFQWFADLEGTIKKYKDTLRPKGIISFSTFGPLTFKELAVALKRVLGKDYIESNGFIPLKDIRRILRINFANVEVFEKEYEEVFSDLTGLLRKIKYTGVRGKGLNGKVVFTPALMQKVEEAYLDEFGGIKATYQVFFGRGMNL